MPTVTKCWACKRRRLKCDGTVPKCRKCFDNGVDCPGYQKPLTWVDGVALRGPMKNLNFGDVHPDRPQSAIKPAKKRLNSNQNSIQESDCQSEASDSSGEQQKQLVERHHWSVTVPGSLTEPAFQDLDYTSRFFLDYYSKRVCPLVVLRDSAENVYRHIMPLVGSSPAVANAMMTLASCHFIHNFTGSPVTSTPIRQQQLITSSSDRTSADRSLNIFESQVSKQTLLNHYLRSKANSLKYLSNALADPNSENDISTLATVLILTILELVESGSGSWAIHLEGVKTFLDSKKYHVKEFVRRWGPTLFDDVIMLGTFGSSLTRPGLLTRSISSQLVLARGPGKRYTTAIGCPLDIVLAIDFFSAQRAMGQTSAGRSLRDEGKDDVPAPDVEALAETLGAIRAFDHFSWAASTLENESSVYTEIPYDDLQRLGYIWKLSAEIYACRILLTLTKDATLVLPALDPLVEACSYFQREDDELLKCLIWPTFLVGAAAINLRQRAWALNMFDRIWQSTLFANSRNAAPILHCLWERQDEFHRQASADYDDVSLSSWDWISELSLLTEDSWLFV